MCVLAVLRPGLFILLESWNWLWQKTGMCMGWQDGRRLNRADKLEPQVLWQRPSVEPVKVGQARRGEATIDGLVADHFSSMASDWACTEERQGTMRAFHPHSYGWGFSTHLINTSVNFLTHSRHCILFKRCYIGFEYQSPPLLEINHEST